MMHRLKPPILAWAYLWFSGLACFAQEDARMLISFSFHEVPLSEVIRDVESRYSITFSYVSSTVEGVKITSFAHEKPLKDAIEVLLAGAPVGFSIVGSTRVVLYHREKQVLHGGVRGVVADVKTREVLAYVNILLDGTALGTYSQTNGRFFLKKIPAGSYNLRITDVSHEYTLLPLAISESTLDLDTVFLEPKVYEGQDILITAAKNPLQVDDERLRIQPGVRIITRREITKTPGILEPDLFRTLQALPGVTTTNDLSNEIYVRGGTPDQNLILLDHAVVYQPYHLFGIAGIFNTDCIDQVYFSPGGFGAQYGDRMSSVIDVRTRQGMEDSMSTRGTLSLLSSKITTEGQLAGNKGYYLASFRRTYVDLASTLLKNLGVAPDAIPYNFYDGYAKVIYHPSANHALGVSFFVSRDDFSNKQRTPAFANDPDHPEFLIKLPFYQRNNNRFVWGNRNVSTYWEVKPTDETKFELTYYQASSANDLSQDFSRFATKNAPDSTRHLVDSLNQVSRRTPLFVDNRLLDRTIIVDADWDLTGDHKLLIGGMTSRINLDYRWKNLENPSPNYFQIFFDHAPDSFGYKQAVMNFSWYVEDLWAIGSWLIRPGIRFDKFESQKKILMSPRLAVRYDVNARLALKASTGLFYQTLFASRERGYVGFLEIPFSTASMTPEKSTHWIIGGEWFRDFNTRISIDLYYKAFSRLYRNRKSTNTTPIFDSGTGRSYGAELNYRHLGSKFTFEVAYSLAWVDRRFYDETYYTNYDQRHTLSVLGSYLLPANWSFDFRWAFSSGRAYRPYTFYSTQYYYSPTFNEVGGGDTPEDINSTKFDHINVYNRYPVYHRLDVSFIKTVRFKRWAFRPYLNIVNAYYQSNPLFYTPSESKGEYITTEPEPRRFYVTKRKAFGIPILPTIGAHFEF